MATLEKNKIPYLNLWVRRVGGGRLQREYKVVRESEGAPIRTIETMTEYWKSNARKFCDYCKCWFADNRASIDFHEAGKKHKENVAKRLKEIGVKGREDYENSLRVDDYMREMEQAALKAYQSDISANPDLTGSAINNIAKEKNADIVIKSDPPKATTEHLNNSDWYEAKSSDGRSYYFHIETKETRWDEPSDFISLEEQKLMKGQKKISKKKKKKLKDESFSREGKQEPQTYSKPKETSQSSSGSSSQSYGSWTTVEKPVLPDLQLPQGSSVEDYEDYDYFPKPEPHQFTQKTVTLGETSNGANFKKRKNCENFKKNARMRNNDL
ncbi:U1-C C2H2-type zinc finger [Trinorchestia longiramus]|nr:U1-C C2H2-type zinc finger [Trinorchestia longiramus]